MKRKDYDVGGVQFYCYDLDDSITAQYCEDHFDSNYYGIKDLIMSPGQTFLDLGANIGSIALYIAKKFPEVKVVAVEALKDTYDLMKLAAEEQGLNNVTCVYAAVAGSNRRVEISVGSGMSGAAKENDFGKTCISVHESAKTLNHLVDEFGFIDIMKINIEGAEHEMFETVSNEWLIQNFGNIVGELHYHKAQSLEERIKAIFANAVFNHA